MTDYSFPEGFLWGSATSADLEPILHDAAARR